MVVYRANLVMYGAWSHAQSPILRMCCLQREHFHPLHETSLTTSLNLKYVGDPCDNLKWETHAVRASTLHYT